VFKFSFSNFLKQKAKEAVKYIGNYEATVVHYCKNSVHDSILCGHIHKPECTVIDGINYYNCGSFIVGENTSYLIETLDGEIKLIKL
jgi:UDP-2,3-diacylglucosamine pyrophosphatase LpxH